MSKHVSVIVPVLKNFKGLAESLHSIVTTYDWEPVIIDNWRNPRCVAASWNEGLDRASGSDYALIINDDILMAPYILDNMIEALENNWPNVIMTTAINMRDRGVAPDEIFDFEPYSDHLLDAPDFSCFVVKTDIRDKVGSFDENFKPAYFEDNDYGYRIRLLNFRAVAVTKAPYFHFGSQTQNFDKDEWGQIVPVCNGDMYRANNEYYVNKWGGDPGFEKFTTPFNDPNMTPKQWGQKRTAMVKVTGVTFP